MSWEWSHTAEAYDNARANLGILTPETLRIIYAEWCATDLVDLDLDDGDYEAALERARDLSRDALEDFIWDQMAEWATCTNGGHLAYACPHGCGCHLVPFDLIDGVEVSA